MEIFELRYFLAVAKHQNIHRASEEIATSPGSLSKALSRLELELETKLFRRNGRNIELTEQGRTLQHLASEIVRLEESTRLHIKGRDGLLHVTIAGPEVILNGIGLDVVQQLRTKYKNSTIEFISADDKNAIAAVMQGTAHLAVTTSEVPLGIKTKTLKHCIFQTCIGKTHPLYSYVKSGKKLPVEKLMEYPFVCPSRGVLGNINSEHAADGWREDKFPRKVNFVTASLKLIEDIVLSGKAVAYLPDYLIEKIGAYPLKINGCPYVCEQKIKLIAKNPYHIHWLNLLF